MHLKQAGNTLVTVALVLLAGLVGGLIALLATQGLSGGSLSNTAVVEQATPVPPASEQASSSLLAENQRKTELIERLQAAVEAGADERSQLAASLVDLNRQVDVLQTELSSLSDRYTETDQRQAQAELDESPASFSDERELTGNRPGGGSSPQQDVEQLMASGLDEQTARDIQGRADQYQLARLELLDQAAREGWADSEQLTDRLAELDESRVDLRDELGDSGYDSYLYNSGHANRVSVSSVITGSAADVAGLEVGDLILRYANERVFSTSDLQQATRRGSRGEYVQLELDRGGQTMSADIPRGPLGVTMGRVRVEP